MEVKGIAVSTITPFIQGQFGEKEYENWLWSLPPESKKIFESTIIEDDWYPVVDALVIPTRKICEIFYNGNTEGAKALGRFSADHSLKGILKWLIQIRSPESLLEKASDVMETYYRPSELVITESEKNSTVLRIIEFPDLDEILYIRMIGWIERALEICGCKKIKINMTASLADGDDFTEFQITWE
ncbi:MAG: hypothetical protein A2V66_08150 [Ignavibacteria bacterium RBG_13_36_8]|nr:MAG: hypothetical protein A2V66_08150 [Ignavibacteria bacterium RBG_13_36_8]